MTTAATLGFLLSWAILLTACSDSDSTGSGGGASSSGPVSSSSSASASAASAGGGGSGGGGQACGMLATYDECDACECEKHQAGCDKYVEVQDDACFCGATAPCKIACATYCGGGAYEGMCEGCWNDLADSDPCVGAIETACKADAACDEYSKASDASCLSLP